MHPGEDAKLVTCRSSPWQGTTERPSFARLNANETKSTDIKLTQFDPRKKPITSPLARASNSERLEFHGVGLILFLFSVLRKQRKYDFEKVK